jgi:hypothetical protein
MEQINCAVFYDIGVSLQNCFNSAFLPLNQWAAAPVAAKQKLDALLRGDVKFKLDESRSAAQGLIEILNELIAAHATNPTGQRTSDDVARFNIALFTFHSAIQLELGRAPIFYVTPKGVYSTHRLVNEADSVFQGFEDRIPKESLDDTREAGRCLAFGLPTAAGFHIARAIESVIRDYMGAYGCTPPKPNQRNWGKYIDLLTAANAEPRIVHHLDQLRSLHRNPVTHPEQTLTMPEAQSLWSMGVSVIQAMVADRETKQAKPNAAVAAMLPPPPSVEVVGT